MVLDQASAPGIGKVTLTVHDLDAVGDFYQGIIGLHRLRGDAAAMLLAAPGGKPLIELRRDLAARRHSHRDAGLFHTAFLLPSRAELARWVKHAVAGHVRLQGASDHLVSEAIYLADPEGNGVEVYADRPREAWGWKDGAVAMATEALDIGALMAGAGDQPWSGMPEGGIVGHVHLQVGALPAAEAFYGGVLGQDITTRYPGAVFFSWGGYHHHIATNIWNSRNAPPRSEPTTGLADVEIITPEGGIIEAINARAAKAGLTAEDGHRGLRVFDPWRTPITIRHKEG